MATLYRVRYFFDPGSGVCLWADNDATRERFGYPVDLRDLPLPESVRRRGYFVLAWYESFADWDSSPEPTRWQQQEWAAFCLAAQELLVLLKSNLGPDYLLVDESSGKTGLARPSNTSTPQRNHLWIATYSISASSRTPVASCVRCPLLKENP